MLAAMSMSAGIRAVAASFALLSLAGCPEKKPDGEGAAIAKPAASSAPAKAPSEAPKEVLKTGGGW